LEDLKKRYGDKVEFLAVYVREAHSIEGWRMESNDKVGISVAQPKIFGARTKVADQCCSRLEISMPLLVDEMNDRVGHLYSGMPDRLYLIDSGGRIAYKSGRGPFGFKTGELEQSLVMLLLDKETATVQSPHGIPIPSHADAWRHLPRATKGAGQSLPSWARALAPTLPRTTAVLLELDYLQRTHSSLDRALRGRIRWVTAHANRCSYTEAMAAADLRRAGLSQAELSKLTGDFSALPGIEREILSFARQLTLAADRVSDEDVESLIRRVGEKQVVAIVLLVAYANFQDRLILALGLPSAAEASMPAPDVSFVTEESPSDKSSVHRDLPANGKFAPGDVRDDDPEWRALDYVQLQSSMEGQRGRRSRITVPVWENVKKLIPANYPVKRPVRIRWSLVCLGYQPELGAGWLRGLRTFADEANQDRVFEESLFWVITRSLHCFY
jgi:alkylhydroperoxidase family enzyme